MARGFNLGQLVATPGALESVNAVELFEALRKHVNEDWGEVCEEDKRANDRALETGARLLSAYTTQDGVKFWIITEADRSSTCVLLPEEY